MLSQIPVELKQLIVNCLQQQIVKGEARQLDLLNPTSMDQTFYQVCSQLNWKHLNFYYGDLPRLSTLNHEIISCHSQSHLVRYMTIRLNDHPPYFFGIVEPEPRDTRSNQIIQERLNLERLQVMKMETISSTLSSHQHSHSSQSQN
ncbi:hypothetical protein MJO28_006447 [Puccinia striiformis f. sp. tritici]|uniref:Uncharacterized protein n=1 Tax=Puccinia striiformis f. sp. tritici TaxID=168172 RepID=A0ACC0EHL4_9BASI|nr:hypothetical protein MJO28_006447 [Puccinia striiformis f. sp. tritici]